MITIKEKISEVSDSALLQKCIYQSTGVFYKLYNNPELLSDKSFKKELISKNYFIDVSMFDYIRDDAKTKLNQQETSNNNKISEYNNIIKLLSGDDINKKTRYKLQNKKSYLEKTINKNCCFGGKALLRNITRHAQLSKNIGGKLTIESANKNKELYKKELSEFRSKRTVGVYLIGKAHECGNRKIDFDFTNGKIIFKPNKNTHIEIKFQSRRNKELLNKIQVLADSKELPITVRITNSHVCFSFDESIVSGYNFPFTEYKRTIHKNNITSKEGKKEIAKQFYKELEQKKLIVKIQGRFASIDINPTEISLVIVDKINNSDEFDVIYKCVFDLEKLCDKTGLSSDSEKQKSYNNKRKHELKEIWKRIFILCVHYKVYNFVTEELNIKTNHKKETNKEFNRQTKSIWHRELSKKLISKWINIFGLNHIEINPAYSSFIGNFIHNEYDPIAAGMEILRRGIVKYIKGNSLYPDLRLINQQKLTYLADENIPCQSWQQLYKQITYSGLRYRNRDKEIYFREGKNFNSYKSRVQLLCA